MSTVPLILVHPPQTGLLEGFSSSLVSLANFVRDSVGSIELTLLDLGDLGGDAVAAEVADALMRCSGTPLVGITTTTATYQSALHVARVTKGVSPESTVVLGGHHAAPEDEVVLRHHSDIVDIVVRGEGEHCLAALVEADGKLSSVPGISFLQDGVVVRTPAPPSLTSVELDQIGITFDGAGSRTAPGKFGRVTYVSARGCPLGCSFCAVAKQRLRCKSIPAVIRDLRILVEDMGFTSIAIEDNFFAQNRRRTLAICGAIKDLQADLSRPFTWDCQTRVESLADSAVVQALKEAGCTAVFLGVESLVPDDLCYLGKTRNPERYLRLLSRRVIPQILGEGMDCYANLQFGIPRQGDEQIEEYLRRLESLGQIAMQYESRIVVHPQLSVLYPGTALFLNALLNDHLGAFGRDAFEHFTAWEAEEEPLRRWLGGNFAHGTGGIPLGILSGAALAAQRFAVDERAVMRIIDSLAEVKNIPGLEVFSYEEYLVTAEAEMYAASASATT